jgi:hypothetical protein
MAGLLPPAGAEKAESERVQLDEAFRVALVIDRVGFERDV